MVNRGGYAGVKPRVKLAEGPTDHILLKLHADGRTEVLVLTQVHAGTRRRIRHFARAVVETPSFPRLAEAGR
jgi:hypothetical protein